MASMIDVLVRLTLASSVALALMLLLRRPLRAWLGACAAYQAWLMVPLALVVAALPALRIEQHVVATFVPFGSLANLAPPVVAADAHYWPDVLFAIWLGGAVLAAALMVRSQRRYVARLGQLERRGDLWFAAGASDGPALLGMRAPRIVVPADFTSRFAPLEQALIIAHEQRHAARRDPLANLLAAALQCAFWFNPIMHYAVTRFRFDQELACDADVLARHPGRAGAYAAAMFKTQVGGAPALATCHWQSSHPLKERIMQLKKTTPSGARSTGARIVLACLLTTCAMAGVAVRAETVVGAPVQFFVAMTIDETGKGGSPLQLLVRDGETFEVTSSSSAPGTSPSALSTEMQVTDAGEGAVMLAMKVRVNNDMLGEPRLQLKLGETGMVQMNGYKMSMRVVRHQPK